MGRIGELLIGLVVLSACGGGERPEIGPEVLDSAGVRIVTHFSASSTTGLLGDQPLLRLGDGSQDTTTLYRVRGGVLTDDGGLVLANAGFHELLYLSAEGLLRQRVGREGQGPGEFMAISWLQARSDGGVNVGDARSLRVTAFASDGALEWSRPFTPRVDAPSDPKQLTVRGYVLSSTDEGAFLAYPSASAVLTGEAGLLPVVGPLRLYDPDGIEFEERGDLTTITWYEDPSAGRIPLGNMLGGTRMWFSGHSGRVAYTESADHHIEVFDRGVRTLRIREVRAHVRHRPDSIPSSVVFVADSMPAYVDLRVDSVHRIWVQAPIGRNRTEWRVFGADGSAVGVISLPEDAEVLDADDSRILLLRRDEFGVESVELWNLFWSAL